MSAEDAEAEHKSPELEQGQAEPQSIAGYELGLTNYSFGEAASGLEQHSTEAADPPPFKGGELKTAETQAGEHAKLISPDAPQEDASGLATAASQSSSETTADDDSATSSDGLSAFASGLRAKKIHSDLAEITDRLFAQGASILVVVGVIILLLGLAMLSPEAASSGHVSAVFGLPILTMGLAGYFNDKYWRLRSSLVFSTVKPVVQRVKILRSLRSQRTIYEVTVPAIDDGESPQVLLIVKSSQAIQLLPEIADARVYRDPSTEKVVVVELDSDIDTGWRLWCQAKPLLGAGKLKDFWWVPQAAIVYFIAAATMLFIVFTQNNARADKARVWPTTEGKIMQAQPVRRAVSCRYSYTVADKQYESDRISMFSRESFIRYRVGDDVVVHYDPKKPSRSILKFDCDWYSLSWSIVMLILSFFSFLVSKASDFKQPGE